MQTSTVEVAGSKIRVLTLGEGEQSVLFVHGLGGWAEHWTEAMTAVAATGRKAVAFDLPGFGQSTPVIGARYFDPDKPFYAEVVAGVVEALGLKQPHLVGHSLGGGIAAVTTTCYSNDFSSLTLVAPGGFGPRVARSLHLLSLPVLGLVSWLPRSEARSRRLLEACFYDAGRIPKHLYEEGAMYDQVYVEAARVMRTVANLWQVRPKLRTAWMARSKAYEGPTLVMWGENDRIVPIEHLAQVQAAYPQAQVLKLPETGHMVMAERPEAFALNLLNFLDKCAPKAVVETLV